MVDLGKQSLEYDVTKPIDIYHQVLDAAKRGDWKTATATAYKLTNMGLEPDNPLVQAAKNMIMGQVQQSQKHDEIYQKDRAAGHNPVTSEIDATTGGAASRVVRDVRQHNWKAAPGAALSGIVDSGMAGPAGTLASAPVHTLEDDARSGNENGMLGDMLAAGTNVGSVLGGGPASEIGANVAEAAEHATSVIPSALADTKAVSGIQKDIAPYTVNVAGVDIPTTTISEQTGGATTVPQHIAKALASPEGAKNFIREQVQPKVVQAVRNNFNQTIADKIDSLRNLKGEESTGGIPQDTSIVEAANGLKAEAKTTYQKLDDAMGAEAKDWDDEYGKNYNPDGTPKSHNTVDDPNAKAGKDYPIGSEKPQVPAESVAPRPKLFSELQTEVNSAKKVLDDKSVDNVAKEQAKAKLQKLEPEVDALVSKYGDVLKPRELDAANAAYRDYFRYNWISKKLSNARMDTGAGTLTKGTTPGYQATKLANLEKQYNAAWNETGAEGAWDDLMGSDAVKNHNDLVNLLEPPKAGVSGLPPAVQKWVPGNGLSDSSVFGSKPGGPSPARDLAYRAGNTAGKAGRATNNAVGNAARTATVAGALNTQQNHPLAKFQYLSPDGQHGWNGTQWIPTGQQ
jgi:hypothetical protein